MKTILLTVVVCTPLGWMWNWWHYYSGVNPAWGFPVNQVIGIDILGVPIEDWVFYPITGGFFVTMYVTDPLKKLFNPKNNPLWLKYVLYTFLIYFIYFGCFVFGKSGTATAVFFGVPSAFLFLHVFNDYNTWHFVRLSVIVVPTNTLWDIWATPTQWYYPADTGIFSDHFWYLGIPAEMTPFLGIMASYFVFSVAISINKFTEQRNVKKNREV